MEPFTTPDAPLITAIPPIEPLGQVLDTAKFSTAHSKKKQVRCFFSLEHLGKTDVFQFAPQFLATLVVTIANVLSGTCLGYAGPALPTLLDPNGTNLYGTPYSITLDTGSWISTISTVQKKDPKFHCMFCSRDNGTRLLFRMHHRGTDNRENRSQALPAIRGNIHFFNRLPHDLFGGKHGHDSHRTVIKNEN